MKNGGWGRQSSWEARRPSGAGLQACPLTVLTLTVQNEFGALHRSGPGGLPGSGVPELFRAPPEFRDKSEKLV